MIVEQKYMPLVEEVDSMKGIRKAHEHVGKSSKKGTVVAKTK